MKLERNKLYMVLLVILFVVLVHPAQRARPDDGLSILISNDDGFNAPGLQALVEALIPIGELVIAAPATDQSGTGHGLTFREPILVHPIELVPGVKGFAIEALPATCVWLGLESLMKRKPDLVISGINGSSNLGTVTFYSGTVGGARQAALLGIPAIAVSMEGNNPADYATAAVFIRELVKLLRTHRLLRPGLFLNVNIPPGWKHGVRIVRQSTKAGRGNYKRRTNPYGQLYFWSQFELPSDRNQDTDVGAFSRGFITVTPLRIDQTDQDALGSLRGLGLQDFDFIKKRASFQEGLKQQK